MGKKVTGMIGQKFGRWTVIKEVKERGHGGAIKYLCKCECGNKKVVVGTNLRCGVSTSCGCYNHDVITKFGKSVYKEKLYSIWSSMKQRCYNPNDESYKNYGGRGVYVCDEWLQSYENFRNWAINNGYKKGLWIDRKDNNGPYAPWNCKFETPRMQQRNKRTNRIVTIRGVEKCLTDWANIAGIKPATLERRIELGWTGEKLLSPVNKKLSHSDEIKNAIRPRHHCGRPRRQPGAAGPSEPAGGD